MSRERVGYLSDLGFFGFLSLEFWGLILGFGGRYVYLHQGAVMIKGDYNYYDRCERSSRREFIEFI